MSNRYPPEDSVPLFRPFTRESLAAIQARISEEIARKQSEAQVSLSKTAIELLILKFAILGFHYFAEIHMQLFLLA